MGPQAQSPAKSEGRGFSGGGKAQGLSRAAGIRKLQQFVDKADADINAQKAKIPKVLQKRCAEELTRFISKKIGVFAAIVREAQSLHASEVVVAPGRNPEAVHRVEESTRNFEGMMQKVEAAHATLEKSVVADVKHPTTRGVFEIFGASLDLDLRPSKPPQPHCKSKAFLL